jgi:hypothetical protein
MTPQILFIHGNLSPTVGQEKGLPPFVRCRVHWPSFETFTRSSISSPDLNVTTNLAGTIIFSWPLQGNRRGLLLAWEVAFGTFVAL